jgi:mannan endo-1,4-beta-mannosidase
MKSKIFLMLIPVIEIIFFLMASPASVNAQNPDVLAIRKYLAELPARKTDRLISGQFERWGNDIQPLNNPDNFVNIVHQKTGIWVGLTGFEYHNGTQVNYDKANRLCIDYWNKGGFSQLYLIMTNPANPGSNNGGGTCDLKLVLNPDHLYHKYFFNELSKVADGLEELKDNGVVIFINMFAEVTGNWFWWGGKDPKDFIALYKAAYDYLVHIRKLDNLLFVYEPSSQHHTAVDYYPGDDYVDVIGISLFVDFDEELTANTIPNYQDLKKLGKPIALSQWGPRRGEDQTRTVDQPPADNMKLIRGIQNYFPEIVWWMNWSYAYSICTKENSNYNYSELLNHPWVINAGEMDWKKLR